MAARIAPSELPASGALPIPRPDEIFDPVARALDGIGDRWTLVLVRHLLIAPTGFQELRARTGIAPRVLSTRLRELTASGYVTSVSEGARSLYALTDRGRSLEPIIAAIARWWVLHALEAENIDTRTFVATTPQSILEALPFLVREERARGVDVCFEIRLEGTGGGVWTVHVHDAACTVRRGFAERADVRYTADARAWCSVALGRLDPREAVRSGALVKDGGREAMDFYFHQIARPGRSGDHEASRSGASSVPRRRRRRT